MSRYETLRPEGYLPRLADGLVRRALEEFGGVEVCGPRWCGKSWTSMAHGSSITRIDERVALYEDDPSLALIGMRPHIVDEWQDVPAIWNVIRHAIDDDGNAPGQFILTGSSSPMDKNRESQRHSGAGRIARVQMSTMTLHELGASTGGVSLRALFDGSFSPALSNSSLMSLSGNICHGGWPALARRTGLSSGQVVQQYLDALFEETMPKAGKSPVLSRRIATSLARNVATSAKLATIAADAASGEGSAPTGETVSSSIKEFGRNYFLEMLPGWDAPVRAKSRLKT